MRALFLGLTLFFTLTLSAQEQVDGPAIEFTSQVVDYGEIKRGSDGIRSFEFTNTGNQPLVIAKVYSSCGCTIPKNQRHQSPLEKKVRYRLSMTPTVLDQLEKPSLLIQMQRVHP